MAQSCLTGKTTYSNARAARTALNQCQKGRGKPGKRRRREESMYLCAYCKKFHLTSELPNGGERFR
jgi:hypothetical protein